MDPSSAIGLIIDLTSALAGHIAAYKNIGENINQLCTELNFLAELLERRKNKLVAGTQDFSTLMEGTKAFIDRAKGILQALNAQPRSIFGRMKNFVFASSLKGDLADLTQLVRIFRQNQDSANLSDHTELLKQIVDLLGKRKPERIEANIKNATGEKMVNSISNRAARHFWRDNVGKEAIEVLPSRLKEALHKELLVSKLFSSADLKKHFDAVWRAIMDDMDENHDEVITVVEYCTYTMERDLKCRFEDFWLATGHNLARPFTDAELKERKRSSSNRSKRSGDEMQELLVLEEQNKKRDRMKNGVDIVFVVDCTESMSTWIAAVKAKIVDIQAEALKEIPEIKQRFAFVGYRDINDGDRRFDVQPFTTAEKLREFLATVTATSMPPTDIPEDVIGGLERASELVWRAGVRVCFLIGDAPSHGQQFYDAVDSQGMAVPVSLFDRYPVQQDGSPWTFNRVLRKLKSKQVDLVIGKIPDESGRYRTERMIQSVVQTFDNTLPGIKASSHVLALEADPKRFIKPVLEVLLKTIRSQKSLPIREAIAEDDEADEEVDLPPIPASKPSSEQTAVVSARRWRVSKGPKEAAQVRKALLNPSEGRFRLFTIKKEEQPEILTDSMLLQDCRLSMSLGLLKLQTPGGRVYEIRAVDEKKGLYQDQQWLAQLPYFVNNVSIEVLPSAMSTSKKNLQIHSADASGSRRKHVQEIIETEKKYFSQLTYVMDHAIAELRSPTVAVNPIQIDPEAWQESNLNLGKRPVVSSPCQLSDDTVATLFSSWYDLLLLTKELLQDMQALDAANRGICSVFVAKHQYLKIYKHYAKTYSAADALLTKLPAENKQFSLWHEEFKRKSGFHLRDYLILPVQRILRYSLLLQAVSRATPSDHPDAAEVKDACSKVEAINAEINESVRDNEQRMQLLAVKQELSGLPKSLDPFVLPHRALLKRATVTILSEPAQLLLCTDILVVTDKKVRYKSHYALSSITLADTNAPGSAFSVHGPDGYSQMAAASDKDREDLLVALKAAIVAAKRAPTKP